MTTCNICACDVESGEESIKCSNNHIIHVDDCLAQYLAVICANIEKDTFEFWKKTQKIKCPLGDCSISEDQIYGKSASITKLWNSTTQKVACVVERHNAIEQVKEDETKEAEKQKKDLEDKMISEITKILSTCISCPHCQQVFFDFSGCLALTCAKCTKGFCGVCLKIHPGSQDAHVDAKSHLDAFDKETNKKYGFHGAYYIKQPGWPLWKEKIKTDRIIEYMKTIKRVYVRNSLKNIIDYLQTRSLLSVESCKQVYGSIFSY